MKKTITINLAGIVFHIEEDAYEALQQYLSSVKQYFLNVEGGADIQGDIESRIAEIFTGFINDFKQAISIEDVQSVIRQMGTVEDMVGDDEEFATINEASSNRSSQNQSSAGQQENKRIVRDSTNALIGGVCAGMAAYFEVNPLWVRLGTLALFFGFPVFPPLSGIIFLSYIVLWIAMPAQANLENKGNFRKYFRSRKDKILGGVAGGIGTYFGVDPVVIRIAFVVFIAAGGSGIILYFLLWMITPEAKSVTDDLQMQGDPVTLNNIEEQIKKNVKLENKEAESKVVKVLVFPFRLIAMVFEAIGPFFRFLFEAFRVFVSLILFVIGAAFLFSIVLIFLILVGVITDYEHVVKTGSVPLNQLVHEITPWMIGFGTLALAVPVIFILLLSVSLMFRRAFIKPVISLVLIGLFLLGSIGLGITLVPFISRISEDGNFIDSKEFKAGYKTITLNMNINQEGNRDIYPVSLTINGWDQPNIKLNQRFEAQGSSWKDARNNARLATYGVAQQDSTLIFDSNLSIDQNLPYRMQRLEMTMYVPFNQKFTMDPSIEEILHMTLTPHGYNVGQIDGNVWMFKRSGLKCLTCPKSDDSDAKEEEEDPQDSLSTTKNSEHDEDWD